MMKCDIQYFTYIVDNTFIQGLSSNQYKTNSKKELDIFDTQILLQIKEPTEVSP